MSSEWEIVRSSGKCAVTQRDFVEGEAYYAVLMESPEGFERKDISLDAWSGPPENTFCYWRARVPMRDRKRSALAVDQTMLVHLFTRLEDEDNPHKQQFRFVLALLLMRKRRLKLTTTVQDGADEYWTLRLTDDQSEHRVVNPRLTHEEVDRLSAQLTAILSGEVEAIESLEEPEPVSASTTTDGLPTGGEEESQAAQEEEQIPAE
ncbi:MAG: hypothetical protein GXY44_09960 [Phycisphaerales bacterium]|nr:hypothetical protein [Phycisphaerales bacterium]